MPLAQGAGGVGLPPVGEPPQRPQPVRAAGGGEQAERAAGVDGAELVVVADEQQLGPGGSGLGGEVVEGEGAGQGRLVDDEQRPGPQPPAVLLRVEPVQRGVDAADCARRRALVAAARRSSRPACTAARCWAAGPVDSCSHFAVFSHGTPSASASSCAAAADGASPSTVPGPCAFSHAVRRARRVVVFPVPAGPTRTSRSPPRGGDADDGVDLVAGQAHWRPAGVPGRLDRDGSACGRLARPRSGGRAGRRRRPAGGSPRPG